MKNKLFALLLSLLIATGLWLYVVTYVSPESEQVYYNIPVVLQGTNILTERGLMITSGENQTVSLTFSGNRSDLKKINSSNITLIADVTKVDSAGVQTLEYSYSLPGEIANNALTIKNWSPKYINVTVEERVSKEIPVTVRYTGSVPTGFIADKENYKVSVPSVSAIGPASVMNQIAKAVIDVTLTDRKESLSESFRYTLCNKEGTPVDVAMVTTNVPEILLELKIQRVKELPLTVKVVDGGGATSATSIITIEPVDVIRVSGNDAMLERLTEYELGTIDLAKVPQDTVLTYPISLPEGVTNLSGVTEVTVRIRFPALMTKEFVVKNITAENVPEGMRAEILSQAVTVLVRGSKADIATMTEKDIAIRVDFSGEPEGTSTVKANVAISTKYPNVGCLGDYSVSATLSKQENGGRSASD